MKVLVIGKGGREHALVWKLGQSPRVKAVFCAPGNAGTGQDGVNVPIEPNDFPALIRFAKKEQIGLTVVGPEDPLAAGIVDAFQREGLKVFGPTKDAAQLEGSKVFAKQLMRHADVPTAEFRIFDHPDPARQYIQSREYVVTPDGRTLHGPFTKDQIVVENGVKQFVINPTRRVPVNLSERLVVKADGLAAGKGVVVCSTVEQALQAVERIMVQEEFGRSAGRQIVIERRLEGQELSILALVAGRTIVPLQPTQDHKAVFDGDQGPNTGGMGAYCPAPLGTPELLAKIDETILVSTVHALKRRRKPFRGVLYAGVMVTNQGPRVLEYNCRFGDPESQPLLMRLRTDLVDLLLATAEDRLDEFADKLVWDPRPAVCVVLCSGGYPGSYPKGKVISGLEEAAKLPDVKVFHAGTKLEKNVITTDGGRVLGVTALGDTLSQAKRRAYEAVEKISFPGMHYRKDIADKALGLV
ncbi:MAG: phosphoribosylamine--glycine ligase [Planctomycetia bacterium]|nr:phosphoribosylamine--glycine ligase [Planctomycetia bacterium]